MHEIISAMDQPSIDGINTYLVSKAASAFSVKTALSGLGGDELLGTYPSFRDIPKMVSLFRRGSLAAMGGVVRRLTSPLLSRVGLAKYAGLLEYGGTYPGAYLLRRGLFMPWEMTEILPPEIVREGWERLAPLERLAETIAKIKSARLKVSALEMVWYMRNQLLRDSDWAGMAHSIEIRVPMVDMNVLRALCPLMANQPLNGKRVLAEVPIKPIPRPLIERPKTGFAVPVHEWLRWQADCYASPKRLSTGFRNWAKYLVREFDLTG
jgi:asparagine synthase (glutamine-hydrolysing)